MASISLIAKWLLNLKKKKKKRIIVLRGSFCEVLIMHSSNSTLRKNIRILIYIGFDWETEEEDEGDWIPESTSSL